ncbi:MAG: hypothetical protein HRU23_18675 [Gammaproteobacteria bacterium]|nr:hypothetical protein [Gammaproteobacteria bacterium]
MLNLSNKNITRAILLSLAATGLTTGCSQLHQFTLGQSYQQVSEIQILDPQAPGRNEGIVLSLDGNYGYAVTNAYRKSNSLPQTARGKLTMIEIGK